VHLPNTVGSSARLLPPPPLRSVKKNVLARREEMLNMRCASCAIVKDAPGAASDENGGVAQLSVGCRAATAQPPRRAKRPGIF